MNATPLLIKIARTLHMVRLETVMVGNAAAALHGAPVTTLDIDFMFRKTPTNLRKLKDFAEELNAQLLKPFYPVSSLYRVVNDDTGKRNMIAPLRVNTGFSGHKKSPVLPGFVAYRADLEADRKSGWNLLSKTSGQGSLNPLRLLEHVGLKLFKNRATCNRYR